MTKLQLGAANPVEVMNHIPIAIYTCDLAGNFSSYNAAALELLGPQPEHSEDIPCHGIMAQVISDGISKAGDFTMRCPDGKTKLLRSHAVPLFDSGGNLFGAMNTLLDVTEQRFDEGKQAVLAAIVESSGDAIISKTLDGIITSWNDGAENIFGYPEWEAVGKHISMLIPDGEHFEEDAILENIRKGNRVLHFQTIRKRKDGRLIPISLTVSPIKNRQGVIIGASKVARDISREKEAEESLRKHSIRLELLNNEVRSLSKKKDEFIALASHELRTPLTSISAYLQLLAKRQTDTTSRSLVDKAVSQMHKLGTLVNDLLDISKMQAGKLGLNKEVFDLRELVLEVVETHASVFEGYEIILEEGAMDVYLEADRHRVEQVVINLMANAVKYSPESKIVVVKLLKDVGQVTMQIKDYGVGIAEGQLHELFTKFFRAEGLASTVPGLGLGLHISQQIINQHHGKIWVESVHGLGTTVSFSLPTIGSD